MCIQAKDCWWHPKLRKAWERSPLETPEREKASRRNYRADNLTSDFQPPAWWGNVSRFMPPTLWWFLRADEKESYAIPVFLPYSHNSAKLMILLYLIHNFPYSFLAVLDLHCCSGLFCTCSGQGLLARCSALASHCGGFSCCGVWAPGTQALVVAVCGLSSCGSGL